MLKMTLHLIKKDLLKLKNYLFKNSLDKNKIMSVLSFIFIAFMFYNSRAKTVNHTQVKSDSADATFMMLFIIIVLVLPWIINKLLYIDKADVIYLMYNKPREYIGAVFIKNLILYSLLYSYLFGTFFIVGGNILWVVKIFTAMTWIISGNFIASLYRVQNKKIISNMSFALIAVIAAILYIICLFKTELIQPLYHASFLNFIPLTGWFCRIMFSQKLELTTWLLFAVYCLGLGSYIFFTLKKIICDCPETLVLMGTNTDLYNFDKIKSETSVDNMLKIETKGKKNQKQGAYAFYLKQKYENAKRHKKFIGLDSLLFLFLGTGFGLLGFLSGEEKIGIITAGMLNFIISILLIIINNGRSNLSMINSHYFWLIPDNPRRKLFYILQYDLLKNIVDVLILNIALWSFWRFNIIYVMIYIWLIPSVFLFNISYSFIAKSVLPFYDATIKLVFVNVPLKLFFSVGISILINLLLLISLDGINLIFELELPAKFIPFSFLVIFGGINLLYFTILYLFFDKVYYRYEMQG